MDVVMRLVLLLPSLPVLMGQQQKSSHQQQSLSLSIPQTSDPLPFDDDDDDDDDDETFKSISWGAYRIDGRNGGNTQE